MLRRLPLIVFIFLIALLRNVDCVTFFRNNYKSQFTNPFESIITSFTQAIGSLNDNISYRKSSATQYREKLRKNVMNIFDSFRSSQSVLSQQTQQEFEVYMNQLNQIYSDTLASLQQQRNYIKELEKNVPSRPKQIDESLERFRKFYDESIIHKIVVNPKLENTSISSFKLPPNVVKTIKRPLLKRPSLRIKDLPKSIQINQKYSTKKKKVFQNMKKTIRKYIKSTFNKSNEENIFRDVTRGLEETSASFSHQMDLLGTTLSSQWSYLTHSIQDIVGTDSTGEGGPMGSQLQSQISVLLQEFSTFQDDVSTRANDILKRSQQAIDDSVNKTDLLREKIELEKQLRLLERTVNTWVEDKFTSMEISVKLLQDKLKISNSLYEELVGKRQAEAAYSHLNDETLRRVLSLIDPADEGMNVYDVYF